jgi:tetratricopeptide (TPR) repeat protein
LLGRKADMLANLGQFERALTILKDLKKGPYTQISSSQQGQILAYIGLLLSELGNFAGARSQLEEALELARRIERPLESAICLYIYAMVHLQEGTPDSLKEGLPHVKAALSLLEGTNWKVNLGDALLISAEIYSEMGETEQALAHSEKAVHLVEGFPIPQQKYELVYSRALRASGRLVEANEYLRRAIDQVMKVAQNLQDTELRQSWLQRVRVNRQILSDGLYTGFISPEETPG